MNPDIPQGPRKRNPLVTGCLVIAGLAVLVAVLLVAGLLMARRKVLSYTDEKPAPIPVYQASKNVSASAERKYHILEQAVKKGSAARVELTADEINALITKSGGGGLKGRALVHIEGDRISADAAIPLDSLPGFSGRWLNGKIDLDVRLTDAGLVVHPTHIVVRGKELPEQIMKKLREKNLAERAYQDPNARKVLNRLEECEVRDGRLVIALRAARG